MTVSATVQALLRPKPDEDQAGRLPAVDQVVVETISEGLGQLENMWTEVPLPITGSETAQGRGSAQADLVLSAGLHQVKAHGPRG
ncbi:hypothetical protein [Streptomyces sp. NPDC006552]|uniref:hypothetical protein n=1 Tax=Streptomyces sp. NPDC006552 TaxID=3157179 RepID=UPI0033A3498A